VVALKAVRVLLLGTSCEAWTVVHDAIDATDWIIVGATTAAIGVAYRLQSRLVTPGLQIIACCDASELGIGTRNQKADGEQGRHHSGHQAHLDDSPAGQIPLLDQIAAEEGATTTGWNRDQTHHQGRVHG